MRNVLLALGLSSFLILAACKKKEEVAPPEAVPVPESAPAESMPSEPAPAPEAPPAP